MAESKVFHCDWCRGEVPVGADGVPEFGAKVTVKMRFVAAAKVDDICRKCVDVYKAVSAGKFRR